MLSTIITEYPTRKIIPRGNKFMLLAIPYEYSAYAVALLGNFISISGIIYFPTGSPIAFMSEQIVIANPKTLPIV